MSGKSVVAQLAADRRAAIVEHVTKAQRGYVGGDQITIPAVRTS